MSADDVKGALAQLASPERAKASSWFFKTAPGQYGEGDRFLGVSVPQQRQVARRYKDEALDDITRLLQSPWHEERLTGLFILVGQYERASRPRQRDIERQQALFDFYVSHLDRVNNWDLVDSSASYIAGKHLLGMGVAAKKLLYRWAASNNRWHRRVAVIATMAFIAEDRFDATLELAERLLDDDEDLLHKAVGWTLREVGKRNPEVLRGFLDVHQPVMPRTMLRYAIEKFSPEERRRYLAKPRRPR